jgi:hypothetical protein
VLVAVAAAGAAAGNALSSPARAGGIVSSEVASEGSGILDSRVIVPVVVIAAAIAIARWFAGEGGGSTGRGWYRDMGFRRGPDDGPPADGYRRSVDTRTGHWRSGDWHGRDLPESGESGARDPDDDRPDDAAG